MLLSGHSLRAKSHASAMLEIRRRLDLGEETLAADDGRQLRLEDLERDATVVFDVIGQVHGRHAAGAELSLDAVSVGQGIREIGDAHRDGRSAGAYEMTSMTASCMRVFEGVVRAERRGGEAGLCRGRKVRAESGFQLATVVKPVPRPPLVPVLRTPPPHVLSAHRLPTPSAPARTCTPHRHPAMYISSTRTSTQIGARP